jgi:tRNA (cytidine/uridine-2'-O-)-methyltransferase
MRLALYQPDMAPNTGTMMRLCACLGVSLDIIEPCGFVFDDRKLKRAAMDYIDHLDYRRHASWDDFRQQAAPRRLILLTTKADLAYHRFSFQADDILMVGRESAGAPDDVHAAADARILIPMRPEARSLNVALSAAIVVAEALRQTSQLP